MTTLTLLNPSIITPQQTTMSQHKTRKKKQSPRRRIKPGIHLSMSTDQAMPSRLSALGWMGLRAEENRLGSAQLATRPDRRAVGPSK